VSVLSHGVLSELSRRAWETRTRARVLGETSVGCAAMDENGRVFGGCNIEHRFRSHDIHAETAAIASMVSGGGRRLEAVLIAAARERFTPCGACLDWIFELGGPECVVIFQGQADGDLSEYTAGELMPHYPM
jgi:cytidine deaminase